VLEIDKFEWSFGSGSEDRKHHDNGYCMMTPGRILRMGLYATAMTAALQLTSSSMEENN